MFIKRLQSIVLPAFLLTVSLGSVMAVIAHVSFPSAQAQTSLSCGQVKVANVTSYSTTQPNATWNGPIQLNPGSFGCTTTTGANPGPWRAAVLDSASNIIARAPSNGAQLNPIISTPPTAGQSYSIACVEVVGNGNETPTGKKCPQITVTAVATPTPTPVPTPTPTPTPTAQPTATPTPTPTSSPTPTATPLPQGCPSADITKDCRVDMDDYSILIQQWGQQGNP